MDNDFIVNLSEMARKTGATVQAKVSFHPKERNIENYRKLLDFVKSYGKGAAISFFDNKLLSQDGGWHVVYYYDGSKWLMHYGAHAMSSDVRIITEEDFIIWHLSVARIHIDNPIRFFVYDREGMSWLREMPISGPQDDDEGRSNWPFDEIRKRHE